MKINKWTLGLAAVGLVSLTSAVQAEEVPLLTALSATTISGYVDTSAVWNPGTGNANPAPFSFNAGKQDGFNVNSVSITIQKPLEEGQWSAGYKADFLLGPDGPAVTGGGPIRQAYVAVRAPLGNGLDFKLGQWDTIIGYESTDSYKNPNYTRNYAYTFTPTEHTGLLAEYKVCDAVSLSGGVANTGNTLGTNFRDPRAESRKAYLASVAVTAPESMGALAGSALYAGILHGFGTVGVAGGSSENQTDVYVGATLATPIKALKIGASYDEVHNLRSVTGLNAGYVSAINGYISFQAAEKLSLHVRGEYAKGGNLGTAIGGNAFTKVIAVTGTVQYDLWANVVSRVEVRWDHAADGSTPFGGTVAGAPTKKNEVMVAANLVYKF